MPHCPRPPVGGIGIATCLMCGLHLGDVPPDILDAFTQRLDLGTVGHPGDVLFFEIIDVHQVVPGDDALRVLYPASCPKQIDM